MTSFSISNQIIINEVNSGAQLKYFLLKVIEIQEIQESIMWISNNSPHLLPAFGIQLSTDDEQHVELWHPPLNFLIYSALFKVTYIQYV